MIEIQGLEEFVAKLKKIAGGTRQIVSNVQSAEIRTIVAATETKVLVRSSKSVRRFKPRPARRSPRSSQVKKRDFLLASIQGSERMAAEAGRKAAEKTLAELSE